MARTVLFSRDDVADFISRNFEPAWEMVRPAPLVQFDFGDGRVVKRTLHGNIASHVCAADGQVLDILPGMYTPEVYTNALERLRVLATSVDPPGRGRSLDSVRQARLREYHRQRVLALALRNPAAAVARATASLDRGKGAFERPLEGVLAGQRPNGPPPGINLANWQVLAEDTQRNETQRRLQIHQRLAAGEPLRPEQIKKWLYKDVLHVDLDDPYLGLRDLLFANDLFRDA